jgi:hypothetical protein
MSVHYATVEPISEFVTAFNAGTLKVRSSRWSNSVVQLPIVPGFTGIVIPFKIYFGTPTQFYVPSFAGHGNGSKTARELTGTFKYNWKISYQSVPCNVLSREG